MYERVLRVAGSDRVLVGLWLLGMWARCCVARLPRMLAVAPVGRVVMLRSGLGCACGV